MNTSAPVLERFRSRLHTVRAHGRISESLLGIALDAVEPFASDYLSEDDYRRVQELVREPVEVASEAALAALVDALIPMLGDADPALVASVEAIRRRSL